MYDYIKGIITNTNINSITLENNGIGYLIYTPKPYDFKINKEYKVNIYQHIREQESTLYGFKDDEDKELFLSLIEVRGLGCKTAIPLLTVDAANIIDAIERENILYLKKFPKIGDKLARQIILDLKGKLIFKNEPKQQSNNEINEALKSLGYKQPAINKILPKLDNTKKLEEQLKEALKLLLR